MILFCILVKHPQEDEPWVAGAWDEWTVEQNYEGWEEAVTATKDKHKESEIRIAGLEVPDGWMSDQFCMSKTPAKPVPVP